MNHGFVIWAECEAQARALANERCGDEGAVWDNPFLAACMELSGERAPRVIIRITALVSAVGDAKQSQYTIAQAAHIGHSDRQVTGHFDAPLPGQADQCPQ